MLFDLEPQLLLVDAIDRIGTKDIAILLSLMQTGIVAETKAGRHREARLQTRVFAASNTTHMPRELLSRFMALLFRPYSHEQFLEVTTNLLRKSEGVDPDLASYIGTEGLERRRRGRPAGGGEDRSPGQDALRRGQGVRRPPQVFQPIVSPIWPLSAVRPP